MPATQTIELHELGTWFQNLADGVVQTDFTPAWRRVGVLLGADMKKNFQGQHSPDGTPWQPLKMNRARNPKGTGQILRDRGLLMASAMGRGPNAVSRETPHSLEWGTNVSYAATHQDGATIRPVKGKALAIPLTREAYRVGSPRNFPRPLSFVWPKGQSWWFLSEARRGKRSRKLKDKAQYNLVPKS